MEDNESKEILEAVEKIRNYLEKNYKKRAVRYPITFGPTAKYQETIQEIFEKDGWTVEIVGDIGYGGNALLFSK